MKFNKNTWILIIFFVCGFTCCDNPALVPKPQVYPRIYYPEKVYKILEEKAPFSFEIPVYSAIVLDKKYSIQNYWYNLNFIPFDATLHLSYYRLKSLIELDSLKEDTRKLAYKHAFRADEIEDLSLQDVSRNLYGSMYLIDGNTATNLNFFLTDSINHFLRGALYFNQKTKSDSIYPVFQFVKKDIEHLINTLKWQN